MSTTNRTPQSRVWLIENTAGPANQPEYQGRARAGAVDWPQGDVTPVYLPSEDSYDDFFIDEVTRGQQGLPTLPLEFRMTRDVSNILRIVRKGCSVDVQLHVGACKDPSDFDKGWEVIRVLERAFPTSYGTSDQGTFEREGDESLLETIPFTGQDYYEIKRLLASTQASTEITDEVVDVVICDKKACGECGIESDGCQVVFALVGPTTGSPGLPSEIVYTQNGGSTWSRTNVSTLGLAEVPDALTCVGKYLVVVSEDSNSLHYAEIADILDGAETWTEVSTGFVVSGEPRDLFSLGRTKTWIVGAGGYVYFSDDVTGGVETQTSGDVTSQSLNAIHGLDDQNLVAVGASNAVLYTANGGSTWSLITGPAAGVALNTVWMRGTQEWFVGTANGKLYYTRDAGQNWTEKAFSGSGAGQVRDVVFATPTVGYMAHDTATPAGRVFRTINGGNTWYPLPEDDGISFPANDRINALSACRDNPNVLFAAGLADDATDGVLIKAS